MPETADTSPTDSRTTVRWNELRWALAGGVFAAAGVFGVAALVGRVSAFEGRRLVEGLKPTATFAAATYVATGATILALMATVIAFSITHESEFRRSHYRRLRIVAALTTGLIVVAIALLTVLVVPIANTETPESGYVALYWTILILGALGGGLTVTIVLMLNYAVRGLIDLGLEGRSFLTVVDREPTGDGTTGDRTTEDRTAPTDQSPSTRAPSTQAPTDQSSSTQSSSTQSPSTVKS